jgi:hypothetical protein
MDKDRHGKEIPARDCTSEVDCGDGAWMSIVNPFAEDSVEWGLRYGNAERMRFVAASVISSYDYLLSADITAKEAIRRLRLLRTRRVELRQKAEAG